MSGDDVDDPQVVHDRREHGSPESGTSASWRAELSTGTDAAASTSEAPDSESSDTSDTSDDDQENLSDGGDLASEALRAARDIAAGRAASSPRRRLSRRRRYPSGEGGYSGARPDARDPLPMAAIVGRSISELGWSVPMSEARLLGQWASVVGPEIAARCQPVSLRDGELRIAAESTAWATQLRLMAPQLLAAISKQMPAGLVKRLTISGPAAPSWKRGPWSMRGGRGVRDTYG